MEPLETKYAHVFVDGEDKYVLIKVLATASEASAQLVVHAQTGDLFVRKVGKFLLDEGQKEKQDPERILFLLQSQARLRGVQLNTAHLCSAEAYRHLNEAAGNCSTTVSDISSFTTGVAWVTSAMPAKTEILLLRHLLSAR